MAQKKNEDTEITQPAADAGGVEGADPGTSLARAADEKLHPSGEPKREADKSSYPVPNDAQLDDPPLRSSRPDIGIVQSLATGAGAHNPPDPEKYDAQGRPRL